MKLFVILFVAIAIGTVLALLLRARVSSTAPPSASPALFVTSQPDWIRVQSGTPEMVQRAVRSYGEVLGGAEVRQYVVVLSRHTEGFLVLTFPDKLPPYPFVNLLGWLDAPPDIEGVTGARGWFTSPETAKRYALAPDHANPFGDTLIGSCNTGESVVVYQPEVGLCATTQQVPVDPEPELIRLDELARLTIPVPLEVLEAFGNPRFVATHPPDTRWHESHHRLTAR